MNVIETIAFLAKGDLRKAINLLQSIYMHYNGTKPITINLCYDIAGIPTSAETDIILSTLLDKTIQFNDAYIVINQMIRMNGYSLSIVLKEIVLKILNNETVLKDMAEILSDLADLENMVSKSTFGDIYITSLVGIFKK